MILKVKQVHFLSELSLYVYDKLFLKYLYFFRLTHKRTVRIVFWITDFNFTNKITFKQDIGVGVKTRGVQIKNVLKNRVICRFRVFLVHRFRFYKQNDILTLG